MVDEALQTLLPESLERGEATALDFSAIPAHSGVALLADGEGRPVLLALGQNLRALVRHRLTQHAEEQPRSKRADLAAVTRQVRWRRTFSRFESALAHWQAARHCHPKGYRKQLSFGPAWMIRVDAAAMHPRFEAVSTFADGAGGFRYFGPYATRRAAEAWIAALQDLFDLCRYHDILVRAPHGEACAYFEMGKCPAPCDGSISMEQYRSMMVAAVDFTAGWREDAIRAVESRIRAESAALRFERAAAILASLNAATALAARPEYRDVVEVTSAEWLVVQPAAPSSRRLDRVAVQAFLVGPAGVTVLGLVRLPEVAAAVPAWLGVTQYDQPPVDAATRTEAFWLVAKFLLNPDLNEGLIIPCVDRPDSDTLSQSIRERFAPAKTGQQAEPTPPTGE